MTDDQLLATLGAALVPVAAPAAPPASALQDLHRAIDATRSGATTPARRTGPRVLPIAVAASVVAACVAIAIVATSLPRIGRETVTQITVSVTSPALGEVTDRRRALESALADRDAAAVARAAARLRLAINDLTPGEWIPIRAEIEDLLGRADTLLERRRGGNDETPGGSPGATSTTQAGAPSAGTQPTTSSPARATSPAAPSATATAGTASGATSSSVTVPDDADDEGEDDDNSGPGGGADDDSSGPGGGEPDDDNSGPGGGEDSGGSGSGAGSGSGGSGSG